MGEKIEASGYFGPSANRISRLRDADGDGRAEVRETFLSGLNYPFGLLALGRWFYVANTDALVRYPYDSAAARVTGPGRKILDLPEGGYNNYWTRNVIASPDGSKLYITVGSATNVDDERIDRRDERRVKPGSTPSAAESQTSATADRVAHHCSLAGPRLRAGGAAAPTEMDRPSGAGTPANNKTGRLAARKTGVRLLSALSLEELGWVDRQDLRVPVPERLTDVVAREINRSSTLETFVQRLAQVGFSKLATPAVTVSFVPAHWVPRPAVPGA